MRKIIAITLGLLTIILTGFTNISTVENQCEIMHNGTFYYGNSTKEVKVVIKGNNHTEYHNNGKYIIKSKLDWVSDCEYNMTMKKVTIPNFPFKVGDVMNVKIDKVEENNIYYTSTVNGQSWNGKFTKRE